MPKLLMLLALSQVISQEPTRFSYFAVHRTASLSGAAETVSVRVAANRIRLIAATVECSVACTVVQTIFPTSVSGVALTPTSLTDGGFSSTVNAFHTTSITGGTALPVISLSAGIPTTFNLESIYLRNQNSAYAIGTNAITGTAKIMIVYREER